MAQKQFLMVLIQQEKMTALFFQKVHLFPGERIDGGNHHHIRFVLPGQRQDEFQTVLPLVTESLPEGHPLGPGRFQGGVSDFYQQIGHSLQM